MRYIIFNKETTCIKGAPFGYKTEGAAKAIRTKMGLDPEGFGIAESTDFFATIEKRVTRKNLMSGKEFTEGVNTSPHMSPACESYWSM